MTSATAPGPFAAWKSDHGAIRVPELDAALAWYTEKLDLRLKQSAPIVGLTFALLTSAGNDGFTIELLAGPGATDRPSYEDLRASYKLAGWHHLGFRVENVDQTVPELKRRNVTIMTEPRDAPALGLRVAFFTDPWDNIFEIIHPLQDREPS